MIYLDTSALTKLVVEEAESSALIKWIADRNDQPFIISALARVELMRAAVHDGGSGVLERAGPTTLRSLDAIHLASAAQITPELTALVANDARLLDGCRSSCSAGSSKFLTRRWRTVEAP